MSEFSMPDMPDKSEERSTRGNQSDANKVLAERLVIRTKMPSTPGYWSDLMLANAAFKSYNVRKSRSVTLVEIFSRMYQRCFLTALACSVND
jgi:hypothetical protein